MKLVCPGCGITASAELWVGDAATRDFVALMPRFPKPVLDELLPYLGLFRPEKRALAMPRAKTLAAELLELVATGRISFDGKPERPCRPEIWAQAMREMVAKKGGQKVHFTSHNYLRAVAYPLADQADAKAERQHETNLQQRRDGGGERRNITAEEKEALRKLGLAK